MHLLLLQVLALFVAASGFRLSQLHYLNRIRVAIDNNLVDNKRVHSLQVSNEKSNVESSNDLSDFEKAQSIWRSGEILKKKRSTTFGTRLPWWMKEEEKKNPNMLPKYEPWWMKSIELVDTKWNITDLKLEAKRRGLSPAGSKADLIAKLNENRRKYSLSDDNFTEAVFNPTFVDSSELPPCYPEVYEKNNQR